MSNRAVRVAWPALTILVATAALVVVLVATGDGGHAALRTGRPVARLVLSLATAGTVGLLAVAALERGSDRRRRLLDVAAVAAGVQAVAAGATGFLLYLGDAPAVSVPAFGPGLVTFALELAIGRAWLAAAIAAAVVSAVLIGVRSRRGAALALGLAILALLPVALQGAVPGDPLAVARTAVTADGLRIAGLAAVLGVATAATVAPVAPRAWAVSLGGALVALVGATSTALLRREDVGGTALQLVDAAALLVVLVAAVLASAPRLRLVVVGARVQLLAAAVAAGIGAAPALTDPVQGSVAVRTTPAQILTGEALPAPAGLWTLLGTWRPDPLLLVVCGALLAAYAVGLVRARAAGVHVSPARITCWIVGVALLLWLTCGGLAVYQVVLLGAYLVQHVALLLVVPLLLAAGRPMTLLEQAGLLRRSPAARRLGDPRVAGAVVAVLLLVLVTTGALRWSIVDPIGAELVDLVLLGAGALLVHGVLRTERRSPAVGVVVGLLVLEAAGGVALLLGTGLLESDWFGAMGWGTDALAAQRAAAVVALLVALPATAALLVAVVARGPGRARAAAAPPLVRPRGADA